MMYLTMINVLMLSNDELFKSRLGNAFNEFMSDVVSFKITTVSTLYEDVKSADILLIDPKEDGINSKSLPKSCAYSWFTEKKTNSDYYIYMYQNIFDICKSIMSIIDNYKSEVLYKSEFFQNTKVVSFISCGGNTGASTISEAFTYNRYSNKNSSVLHITLSPIKNSIYINSQAVRKDIFFENVSELLSSNFINNLEVINGFKNIHSAMCYSNESLKDTITFAKKLEFDYIVLDFELSYVSLLCSVLDISNSIVLVTNGSKKSTKVMNRITEYISSYNYSILEKVKVIHNLMSKGANIDSSSYRNSLICELDTISNEDEVLSTIASKLNTIEL